MKKKIIFMMINMNVGGTEKALLNMISEIPEDKYEITILMLEEFGGFLEFIPKHVHVKYLQEYNKIKELLNQPLHLAAFKALKEGNITKGITLLLLYLVTKLINDRSILFKFVLKDFPKLYTQYDIAVAYAGPMDLISYFVINKINAKMKFQWIHFDITKIGFNVNFAKKVYKKFNRIFVVSNEAKTKLIEIIPSLSTKTKVFLNMVSEKSIRDYAKKGKGFTDDYSGLRILTVGRLSSEKGQDLAILALENLIKDGYNVRWYCIGEGNMREYYEKLIAEKKLEEHFIFLGSNTNPYPYFEQCDIYVQPSRYEGFCITIIEAKYFCKPIVATNVNGVGEQISSGKTGLIVNVDEKEIYAAIKKLLKNKEVRNNFSRNLAQENIKQSKIIFS